MKFSILAALLSATGAIAAPTSLSRRTLNPDKLSNLVLRKSDLHLTFDAMINGEWKSCELTLTPSSDPSGVSWGVCPDGYASYAARRNVIEDFQVEGGPEWDGTKHEFYGQGINVAYAHPDNNFENDNGDVEIDWEAYNVFWLRDVAKVD